MSHEMKDAPTLSEATRLFLASIPQEQRPEAQTELSRFTRWYGNDRKLMDLTGHDVATYAETVGQTTVNATQRLECLRAFFTFVKRQGYTSSNLATSVRLKKAAPHTSSVVSPATRQAVLLTKGRYVELQAELEALKAERPRLAEELRLARADKDFRENAPLDAARERQAHVEARIRQLEATLKEATLFEQPITKAEKVSVGSTITIRDLDNGQILRYTLVSPSEIDLRQGKISYASPTGKAFIDHVEGDEVAVEVPAGVLRYRVEKVEHQSH